MKDFENFKENIKFILIVIFLSILIFFMGLFATNSIGHSIVLIYFILSFLVEIIIYEGDLYGKYIIRDIL